MTLFWTAGAEAARSALVEFIAQDNVLAALEMDELFSAAARRILSYPAIGKVGRVAGTREFVVHEHYILVYEVHESVITVLTLLHTARQWPPLKD